MSVNPDQLVTGDRVHGVAHMPHGPARQVPPVHLPNVPPDRGHAFAILGEHVHQPKIEQLLRCVDFAGQDHPLGRRRV